ncbi:MAG TPA: hypothetical protein V6D06_17935 [Trichocoleus sp.]
MPESTTITKLSFANGQQARALQVGPQQDCLNILKTLRLPIPSPTLVVIGGASKMSTESLNQLSRIFVEVLAPLAEALNLVVVDGGTDAGVIQMMGQARQAINGSFRLVGVVPAGKVSPAVSSDPDAELTALEPHHTDFCLIPGDQWGHESPWIARLATALSQQAPCLTLLINGGKIALVDLLANLETGRPALVLAGSGRLADTIGSAVEALALSSQPLSEQPEDPLVTELVITHYPHQLSVFNLAKPLDELTDLLNLYFTPQVDPPCHTSVNPPLPIQNQNHLPS